MSNQATIVCPHCQKEFPLTQALSHEYELKALEKAEEKVRREMELELKNKANETHEANEQIKKLQAQLLGLSKTMRDMQRAKEQMELDYQKKLAADEEKIRQEAKLKTEEEHRLKEAEKDKLITDLKRDLDETKKRLEQGSQQTQGEVLELEFQKQLQAEFPLDSISEIKKGVHGADILQTVIDRNGQECGKILWETKNGEWSNQWQGKLREDQRDAGAEVAGLVCSHLPKDINNYAFKDGVWVSSVSAGLNLAASLRFTLVYVNKIRMVSAAKGERKDDLYDYVTSVQFQHKVEAMMDAYQQFLDDIDKQKRYFTSTWARQEKSVRTLMEQTGAIHGELSGIVGKALPPVASLELREETS